MRRLSRFSTSQYSPAQRTGIWRDYLRDELFLAEYRPLSDEGILSDHAAIELDEGRLHSFTSNAHTVDLTAASAVAATPQLTPHSAAGQPLYFTTVLAGRAMYWSHATMEIAQPGETLVYDPTDPFFITFHDDTQLLLFESHGGACTLAETWGGRPCLRIRSTSDVAQQVYRGLHFGAEAERQLSKQVAQLIHTVERQAGEQLSPGPFSAALAYIEAQYADPHLSVESVARHVHLSPRQLTRVFSDHGETVIRSIIHRRMEHARGLLASPATNLMSIQELAAACGYGSAAHFSPSFTAHYGVSPTTYRKQQRAAGLAPQE